MNFKKKGTILVVSNYAWTILNFRLPLIKSLREAGYRVVVLTQYDGNECDLLRHVDEVRPLFISRKGINPFIDFVTFLNFVINILSTRPIYIFLFTIKPVIYGALAAKFVNAKVVVTITGLGTAFLANNWLTSLVSTLYKYSLSSVYLVFFQNEDDRDVFIEKGLVKSRICRLVPGSGIDVTRFAFSPLPNLIDTTFLLIARMLWDKGVGEYVDAARIIKTKYPNIRLQLLGPVGVENRTGISIDTISRWMSEGVVDYLGEADDVRPYIAAASCIVLPSYREGTSRVLLEAAAMGRPTVASDVPGCRDVVDDGVTGFLCKPKDCVDLAEKLESFLNLPVYTRNDMGLKAPDKIVRQFDQRIVSKIYMDSLLE